MGVTDLEALRQEFIGIASRYAAYARIIVRRKKLCIALRLWNLAVHDDDPTLGIRIKGCQFETFTCYLKDRIEELGEKLGKSLFCLCVAVQASKRETCGMEILERLDENTIQHTLLKSL